MAEMHAQGMLFPPLVEEVREGGHNQQHRDDPLPQDIKDRFSKVRCLLREKASSEDTAEAAELKRKQEAAAVEAARAVQEEVARLQNGIAELEALCAMQQHSQRHSDQPLPLQPDQQSHGDNNEDDDDDDESHESDDEDDGFGGMPVNIIEEERIGLPMVVPMMIVGAVEPDSEDRDTRSTGTGNIGSNGGSNPTHESGHALTTQLLDA